MVVFPYSSGIGRRGRALCRPCSPIDRFWRKKRPLGGDGHEVRPLASPTVNIDQSVNIG